MTVTVRYPKVPSEIDTSLDGKFDVHRLDPDQMNKDFCLRPYCEVSVFKSPVDTLEDTTLLISAETRKSTPQILNFEPFQIEFAVTDSSNQLVR